MSRRPDIWLVLLVTLALCQVAPTTGLCEATSDSVALRVDDLELSEAMYEARWRDWLATRNGDQPTSPELREQFHAELRREFELAALARALNIDAESTAAARVQAATHAALRLELERTLRAQIRISDEQVRRWYDANPQAYRIPGRAQIRLIQTDSLAAAERAVSRLAEGEAFDQVARELSIHPSKSKGGALPAFARGAYHTNIEVMAFSLNVGQFSPIIQTELGYWLIEVAAREPERRRPLAEARETIRQRLKDEALRRRLTEALEQFRSDDGIDRLGDFE